MVLVGHTMPGDDCGEGIVLGSLVCDMPGLVDSSDSEGSTAAGSSDEDDADGEGVADPRIAWVAIFPRGAR